MWSVCTPSSNCFLSDMIKSDTDYKFSAGDTNHGDEMRDFVCKNAPFSMMMASNNCSLGDFDVKTIGGVINHNSSVKSSVNDNSNTYTQKIEGNRIGIYMAPFINTYDSKGKVVHSEALTKKYSDKRHIEYTLQTPSGKVVYTQYVPEDSPACYRHEE